MRKQIIPTDNTVISEWQLRSGDSASKIITLSKLDIQYALKKSRDGYVLGKKSADLRSSVFGDSGKTAAWVETDNFVVLMDPYPQVTWTKHPLETSLSVSSEGTITKYYKDGSVIVLYPSGDTSVMKFGEWQHVRDGKIDGRELTIDHKTEGSKNIDLREDGVSFVT